MAIAQENGMKRLNIFDKALGVLLLIAILLFAAKALSLSTYQDKDCLAQNIYFEAGNQPFSGKLAVANVVLNRVESTQFPNTICEVVYQAKEFKTSWKTGKLIPIRGLCQFSWFCDGYADEPQDSVTWTESARIAEFAISSQIDITNGALYYHANYTTPYWAAHLERLVQIETHIFYK